MITQIYRSTNTVHVHTTYDMKYINEQLKR